MTSNPLSYRIKVGVQVLRQHHGWRFPLVAAQRGWVYLWRKLFSRSDFQFEDQSHSYVIHPFILDNERTVEVALALDFLRDQAGPILEVGNVLANFASMPREVVDKYEKGPGVINQDIVDYAPARKYNRIVTLSTLEHVGWDEEPREPEKISRAIEHLKTLLSPGGELLATMPLGYNEHLDRLIREGRTGFGKVGFLRRVSADNQWREASLEEVAEARFGSPYGCANAIMVGRHRRAAS